MSLARTPYVYQKDGWPEFRWNNNQLIGLLANVRSKQGLLLGKMNALGFDLQSRAALSTLTLEVVKSNEIEGEVMHAPEVRSSLARRLGMNISGLVPSDERVDGMVDMLLDAVEHCDQDLTKERLCDWHRALFPAGISNSYRILTGNWRDDSDGPMQVVSGALGKEKVHFEAPPAAAVPAEMMAFMDWVNTENGLDPVLKAGVAHFWFITVHPFEDGNGRIARAVTDMLLTRADGVKQRYYSMSAYIRAERNAYYQMLEKCQQGTVEITRWLTWFLECLASAIEHSNVVLGKVLYRHNFWNATAEIQMNARQKHMLDLLLDDFKGKLTSSKWGKISKCSADTALRDIQHLVKHGVLVQAEGGGRSTNYELSNIADNG